MWPAYIILFIIFVIGIIVFVKKKTRDNIRKMLLSTPMRPEWIEIIKNNVPMYNKLPETLKRQLHGLINIFLVDGRN